MGYIIKSANIESGTWTPVFSIFTGNISNATALNAFYSKVDNIVNCTIYGLVDANLSIQKSGAFITSFPISTVSSNSIGLANYIDYSNGSTGRILGNKIALTVISNVPTIATFNFVASFQYEIN
jgi:hypothetical protein